MDNFTLVEKNKNSFLIKVELQRNSERYRKQFTFHGTKTDAKKRGKEIVLELERQAESDEQVAGSSLKYFNELVDFYVLHKSPKRGDITYIKRLQEVLGSRELTALPEAFDQFILLLSRSRTFRGKPYSAATRNRYRSWYSAVLNFAYEQGVIETNPMVRKLRKEKEIPRDLSLTDEEVGRLFEAIDTYRPYLRPIVMFLLQIPCRKAELLNARRTDIDTGAGYLRIRSGKTKNGQGINKPIPPNLDEYFRKIPAECPWVFYRVKDGVYYPLKSIDDAWRFCRAKAGLDEFRIHDTRHFSATKMINNGVAERVVMDVASWKTNMLSLYYHRCGTQTVNAVRAMLEETPVLPATGS